MAKKEQRFRAKQRMENLVQTPAGEESEWVVDEGRVVAGDHPALKLHPDMFEELE